MPTYDKPSAEMVYDLINEANPSLPFQVSPSNMNLGVPSNVTPSGNNIQDTQITLSAKPNSDFIGRASVRYRRINLGTLFRGMVVQIAKWSPNLPGGSGTTMFTVHQLLDDINAKYGIKLSPEDVTNQNITRGNTLENGKYTRTVTVAAAAGSLGFKGSFTLKWLEAPRDLEGMVTLTDIAGRAFPGGNVFDENHLKVMNFMATGIDWTDQMTGWTRLPFTRQAMVSGSTLRPFYETILIPWLNATYGLDLTWADWSDRWFHTGLAIPAADLPEANSRYCDRLIIIEPPTEAGERGVVGRLMIHLNSV